MVYFYLIDHKPRESNIFVISINRVMFPAEANIGGIQTGFFVCGELVLALCFM